MNSDRDAKCSMLATCEEQAGTEDGLVHSSITSADNFQLLDVPCMTWGAGLTNESVNGGSLVSCI
jgi:hypothetical protein